MLDYLLQVGIERLTMVGSLSRGVIVLTVKVQVDPSENSFKSLSLSIHHTRQHVACTQVKALVCLLCW